jgi:hypothetical protein
MKRQPVKKPVFRDGPPGFVRVHKGYCPRAWTADGTCTCYEEAELLPSPEGVMKGGDSPPARGRRKVV